MGAFVWIKLLECFIEPGAAELLTTPCEEGSRKGTYNGEFHNSGHKSPQTLSQVPCRSQASSSFPCCFFSHSFG